ncbi:MAG: hypothetical protein ACXABU_07760 [Candidatus Hodarchaeales archaeon]
MTKLNMNTVDCVGMYVKWERVESVLPVEPEKEHFFHMNIKQLDVHPVSVHFTISYIAVIALLYIISIFSSEILGISIEGTRDLQIIFFPLLVIGGGITGIIDGKVRFRKLSTPYLQRKIILGSVLFVVSVLILFVHNLDGTDVIIGLIEGLLIFSAFGIASYLGWIGAEMICPIVPVGRPKE